MPTKRGQSTNRTAVLHDAIEHFYFAYRAFTAHPDRLLAQRGLNRVHHRILYFVGRNPSVAVNELLTTLNVSKQALHAPLRQLLAMKFIAATAASHDRRVKQLALTVAGKQFEDQLTRTQIKQLTAVFDDTGPHAEKAWLKVLKAVASADQERATPLRLRSRRVKSST